MKSLISLSATEMRQGLLSGDFSSEELVKAHFERIEQTNPDFNSFILTTGEHALDASRRADKLLSESKDTTPPLTGIPVAIKDLLVTKGIETTCGSKILKGFIPPYNCTAVARLEQAGAIVVGKTNLDEFAMGSSSETSAFGPVRNPYDTTRVSGGSSGGSAVAVCSGQSPIALGTDTGGSIRQPASFTGVLGLKPTYGRVSRYGAVAYASSFDQIGPFARTVEDIALVLGAIAGKDENDSTSMDVEIPDYVSELQKTKDSDLAGLRVGVPKEYLVSGVEPDVEKTINDTLKNLTDLKAEVVEISLPHTEYALATYYILVPAEASSNLSRYDGVRYGHRSDKASTLSEMYEKTRAEGFCATVKHRILIGTYVLSAGYYDAYYHKAQQVRTLIIEDFRKAFSEKCDVIIAPASPFTAFKVGEKIDSPVQMYLSDIFTVPISLAGLPGMSVPCGIDSSGLPVGMQLVAQPFAEPLLLRTSQALLKENGFDLLRMTS